MSYIEQHMVEALSEHKLTGGPMHYVMKKPGTGCYRVDLVFVAARIVVTGDIGLGANQHGVVSSPGYEVGWFSGTLSEGYLCEKFLAKEWQWEAAAEQIADWVENPDDYETNPEHVALLRKLLEPGYCWNQDKPMMYEVYDSLFEIGQGYIDDGIPGMDYPRAEAGWLCAIQQRFAALAKEVT